MQIQILSIVPCSIPQVLGLLVQSLDDVGNLQPYGLQPAKLLCPWDSPGKNTGVGCHFLLQGNLPHSRSLLFAYFIGSSMFLGASQVALVVKNLPDSAGDIRDSGSIPGLGRSPGGGHGNPLLYSCLENPHGQRSLAGYSPWSHKESDATELTQHSHSVYRLITNFISALLALTIPFGNDTFVFYVCRSISVL